MGMDQQLLAQKKGTAKTIIENGKELGYWRNKYWIDDTIKHITDSPQDKNIIRITMDDLDVLERTVINHFSDKTENFHIDDYTDPEDMSSDESMEYILNNILERFVVPIGKAKMAIKCGWQVYYLSDY